MTNYTTSKSPAGRRADLDVLRVGAIGLLIVFHVSKIYDPRPFQHYWSPDLIPGLDEITGFMIIWRMPLLFLVAGWSAVLSFRSRGMAAFMRERARRIALPLFFGIVFLCPLLKYIELRSGVYMGTRGRGATAALQEAHGSLQAYALPVIRPYTEPFFTFLPEFYTSLKFFTWSHLWFLAYLLVITSVAAPLLARLARKPAKPARYPLIWFLVPAIVLAASETILRPFWPNNLTLYNDWANIARYSLYFAMGVFWAPRQAFSDIMSKRWPLALAMALALFALHKLLAGNMPEFTTGENLATFGLPAAAGWFFVLFLLGIAARYAQQGNWLLAALSAAVLPIYIIHQPAIVISGYLLDGLALPVGARFILIFFVSLLITLAIVYGPAKRYAILRAGLGHGASGAASWGAAGTAALFVTVIVIASRVFS